MRSYLWPENVVWETTLACNMRCRHCGSIAGDSRDDELSTKEALDLCDQLADLGCKVAILSGGETFLRPDWPLLSRALMSYGIRTGIITNGLALEEDRATLEELRQIRDEIGPLTIGLSLDGLQEAHEKIRAIPGSYEMVLRCMDLLQQEGLPVVVLTTVNKNNLADLRRLRDEVLFPRAMYAWQVQTCNNYGRMKGHPQWFLSREEYIELAEIMAETRRMRSSAPRTDTGDCIGYYTSLEQDLRETPWRGCQAGLRTIGIQSNGGIKGCLSLLDDIFLEGNIRQESLSEIWDRPGAFAYNREFEPEQLRGMCQGCEHGKACAAGCRGVCHSITGYFHEAPYCLYGFQRDTQKAVFDEKEKRTPSTTATAERG